MKAKLLRDAGDIAKGKPVDIKSTAGSNDARSTKTRGTEYYARTGLQGNRRRRTHGEGRHARPSEIALSFGTAEQVAGRSSHDAGPRTGDDDRCGSFPNTAQSGVGCLIGV